jgi:hypothetical protein
MSSPGSRSAKGGSAEKAKSVKPLSPPKSWGGEKAMDMSAKKPAARSDEVAGAPARAGAGAQEEAASAAADPTEGAAGIAPAEEDDSDFGSIEVSDWLSGPTSQTLSETDVGSESTPGRCCICKDEVVDGKVWARSRATASVQKHMCSACHAAEVRLHRSLQGNVKQKKDLKLVKKLEPQKYDLMVIRFRNEQLSMYSHVAVEFVTRFTACIKRSEEEATPMLAKQAWLAARKLHSDVVVSTT